MVSTFFLFCGCVEHANVVVIWGSVGAAGLAGVFRFGGKAQATGYTLRMQSKLFPRTSNYKTSGSITTSNSTTGKLSSWGSSTFMASASSGGTSGGFDEAAVAGFLKGQILEAPNLRTFTFLELKTATKNFRPDNVLGKGGFARVYKGWVDEKTMNPTKSGTGMVVTVKKLNSKSMQGY